MTDLGIAIIKSILYNEFVQAEKSRFDMVLEAIAFVSLVAMFVVVGSNWGDFPDRIPVHFGPSGLPDSWGGKDSIWLLPGIGLLTYSLLSFSRGRPQWINIPFALDKFNPEVLAILNQFILATKASVMVMLGLLSWRSVEVALGRAAGLGMEFLPITFALVFLPMAAYLPKLWRHRLI